MAEELPPFEWGHVWQGCCRHPETCNTSTKIRFAYGCFPYTDSERLSYLAAIEKALAARETEMPHSGTDI